MQAIQTFGAGCPVALKMMPVAWAFPVFELLPTTRSDSPQGGKKRGKKRAQAHGAEVHDAGAEGRGGGRQGKCRHRQLVDPVGFGIRIGQARDFLAHFGETIAHQSVGPFRDADGDAGDVPAIGRDVLEGCASEVETFAMEVSDGGISHFGRSRDRLGRRAPESIRSAFDKPASLQQFHGSLDDSGGAQWVQTFPKFLPVSRIGSHLEDGADGEVVPLAENFTVDIREQSRWARVA